MATLPSSTVSELWSALQWTSSRLVPCNSSTKPLAARDAPRVAGLYRIRWLEGEEWCNLEKSLCVRASVKVSDTRLHFGDLTPPVVITIGRTTNLHERIRQHFSTNRHNNRVLSRLKQLAPSLDFPRLLELAVNAFRVEWTAVPNWIERCLLEKYGVVTERPIFDLDAEH